MTHTREPLKVLGHFLATMTHKGKTAEQQVLVVEGLKTNLLGLPAIQALHLAARIDETNITTFDDVRKRFPKDFQGLGNLGEEFKIRLKPNAAPHALFTPRNVPMPLRPKVEEELHHMTKLGVIPKVHEPTPWCTGMVVVPKKPGKVRICVDLKPLNESVLVHPLPKVDETLTKLSRARVFSKLDASSGFWQIPLTQESRLLTAFITPFSRYCFNKLPFGIYSAPEHFQRRMMAILEGLQGVVCQMDDVLVFGSTHAEHNIPLNAVFERIQKVGATLNADKCDFHIKE